MENLFEGLEIAEDKKEELQEAFEKAVLKETTTLIDEAVDKMVDEKVVAIEEEYTEKVSLLEDSLDGYLDTVVEEFIAESTPVLEAEIDQAKASTLLEMFDKMAHVLGVDIMTIAEAKDSSSADSKVAKLETKLSEMADKLVDSRREADEYLKSGLVAEMSEGLTLIEADKFKKLADLTPFDRSEKYLNKLETIKESLTATRKPDAEVQLPSGAFKASDAKVDSLDFAKYL